VSLLAGISISEICLRGCPETGYVSAETGSNAQEIRRDGYCFTPIVRIAGRRAAVGVLEQNSSDLRAVAAGRGGVQNNSLGRPGDMAQHPVWTQTALAAQDPPLNPVRLFVGLQVGAPDGFYLGDSTFADFESDDQTAVNWAKQMVTNY
jgi:hypothetical protein